MRNVSELRVGDLLIYIGGGIGVVCCTTGRCYKIYYVDNETSFISNTPQNLFNRGFFTHTRIIRI